MNTSVIDAGGFKATLPINIGTELLVELVEHNLRLKSELVGMEAGQYLIIKLTHKEIEATYKGKAMKGSPLIVRYLYRGSVYGFKTQILDLMLAPARLIFAQYPTNIEEHNFRTNKRFECILPGQTVIGDETVEMVLADISSEGCRCIIRPSVVKNPGALSRISEMYGKLDISIPLPGHSENLKLRGTIRNLSKDSERIIFGLMFDEMQTDARQKIGSFISLVEKI